MTTEKKEDKQAKEEEEDLTLLSKEEIIKKYQTQKQEHATKYQKLKVNYWAMKDTLVKENKALKLKLKLVEKAIPADSIEKTLREKQGLETKLRISLLNMDRLFADNVALYQELEKERKKNKGQSTNENQTSKDKETNQTKQETRQEDSKTKSHSFDRYKIALERKRHRNGMMIAEHYMQINKRLNQDIKKLRYYLDQERARRHTREETMSKIKQKSEIMSAGDNNQIKTGKESKDDNKENNEADVTKIQFCNKPVVSTLGTEALKEKTESTQSTQSTSNNQTQSTTATTSPSNISSGNIITEV